MADVRVGPEVKLQAMGLDIEAAQQRLNIQNHEYRKATLAVELERLDENIKIAQDRINEIEDEKKSLLSPPKE